MVKTMASSEEEPYSNIFASLNHPVRRKILRMLSQNQMSFSEILDALGVSSSFLTYHIENLGELVSKTSDGKYRLSSFGEAAMATMTKVEDIPSNAHHNGTRLTRFFGRTTVIALGIMCIVLAATVIGTFAYYAPLTNDKNNTISSLNTLISQLDINITDLQNELNALNQNMTNLQNQLSFDNFTLTTLQTRLDDILNLSSSMTETVMNDPYAWENKTVIIIGSLALALPMILPYKESLPYGYELSFGNYTIGVSINDASLSNLTLFPLSASIPVMIYGTVVKGEIYWTGLPSEVTYYIDTEAVVQIGPPIPRTYNITYVLPFP
jgi:DNA-binding HxlR family transcriptional regulator